MINLNKLKEIDNSILNNAKDKEVLLNDYSTALSQLDKINEKFKICLDLVLNLDEVTELISKIAKKLIEKSSQEHYLNQLEIYLNSFK